MGDYWAQIEGTGDHPDYVLRSFVPLRAETDSGEKEPIDLTLREDAAAFEPTNSVAPFRIGKRAGDGVDFERAGFAMRPTGDAGAAAEVVQGRVFYPSVETDTDFFVAPRATGVEALWVVRSAEAPQTLTLEFFLPDGVELRRAAAPGDQLGPGVPRPTGGFEVVRDGTAIGRIDPPAARDADGEPVELFAEAAGNRLQVQVPHRSGDYLYPILVDPVVEDFLTWKEVSGYTDPSLGFDGWEYAWGGSSGTLSACRGGGATPEYGDPWGCPYPFGYGRGLYLWGTQGSYYSPNRWHEWIFRAPGNSYIYRADFGWVKHDAANIAAVTEGIWSTRDSRWETFCVGEPNQPCTNSAPWSTFASLNYNFRTHCPPSIGCWQGYPGQAGGSWGTPGNVMAFAQTWPNGGTAPGTPLTFMGGAQIGLHEYSAPRLDQVKHTNLPSGWVGSASPTVEVSAIDDGLGLKSLWLSSPRGWSGPSYTDGCSGSKAKKTPCSPFFYLNWNYSTSNMPEGIVPIQATAEDIVDNQATLSTWQLKLDRGGPVINPSGALYDRRNQTTDHRNEGLYDASYNLHIDASDGSGTSDATKRSGVKSIEIQVDGQRKDYIAYPCLNGQCNYSEARDYTLRTDDFADGDHTIKVIAKDLVGNSTEKSWTVTVDRRGDVYHAKQYTGDPSQGGTVVAEEWARIGTLVGRFEADEQIETLDKVTCEDPTLGTMCWELRTASQWSRSDPGMTEDYSVQTYPDGDPNLESITDLTRPPVGSLTSVGPIDDALSPWQVPPPARGSEYELHERTVSSPEGDDEGPVDVKVWRDRSTKMPLKARGTDVEGGVVYEYFWSYESQRRELSELPADHFRVGRPSNTDSDNSSKAYGQRPIGLVTDDETGSEFLPYYLGTTVPLGGRVFCPTGAEVVRMFDRWESDVITDPDPPAAPDHDGTPDEEQEPEVDPGPEPLPVDDDIDLTSDPYGPETFVGAYYKVSAAGESCDPGGAYVDSPLFVLSMRRDSSMAAAHRAAYTDIGTEVDARPDDDDFLFSGRLPVLISGQTTTAYLVRTGENESSALFDLGDSTVIITGEFSKADFGTLIPFIKER